MSLTVQERRERVKELQESMNPKHMAVCAHILLGMNQGEAWMAEYPRVKKQDTASANCTRMLNDAKTGAKEYIIHQRWFAQATAAQKLGIDEYYLLENLKNNLEKCLSAVPVMEKDPDTGDWVESGEWKFEHAGANRALELMGKHLGMFTEKVAIQEESPITALVRFIREQNSGASPLPSGE